MPRQWLQYPSEILCIALFFPSQTLLPPHTTLRDCSPCLFDPPPPPIAAFPKNGSFRIQCTPTLRALPRVPFLCSPRLLLGRIRLFKFLSAEEPSSFFFLERRQVLPVFLSSTQGFLYVIPRFCPIIQGHPKKTRHVEYRPLPSARVSRFVWF